MPALDRSRWSARCQEFLTKWYLHGASLTLEQFCQAYGYDVKTYQNWRDKLPGFGREFDRIALLHDQGSAKRVYGLKDEEALFLRHYKESGSKVYALEQVAWSGQDYNKALRGARFAQELESITQELMLQVEDEVFQKAKTGSLGHQRLFLEQADPERYAPKSKKPSGGTPAPIGSREAQQRRASHWGAVFGAAAARPTSVAEDPDDDLDRVLAPN